MQFYYRHEWIVFLKATEVARRIVADPSMIDDARRFVAARMVPDPHQCQYATMWQDLLSRSPGKSPRHSSRTARAAGFCARRARCSAEA
jgi:hypothetical protein